MLHGMKEKRFILDVDCHFCINAPMCREKKDGCQDFLTLHRSFTLKPNLIYVMQNKAIQTVTESKLFSAKVVLVHQKAQTTPS